MNYPPNQEPQLPPDPFEGDPNDPATLFEPEEPAPELTAEERADMVDDLARIDQCIAYLQPQGIRGIFFECMDCEEMHYYDWEIMRSNLMANLMGKLAPVHEPSVAPAVEAYVTWDYAVGFVDGVNSARQAFGR